MRKLTILFALLCASMMSFAIDWSGYSWIGNGSGNAAYTEAMKIDLPGGFSVVNLQSSFGTEAGIYITTPSAAGLTCDLGDGKFAVQGTGMLLYLSAFTLKETPVTVTSGGTDYIVTVYWKDGAEGGGGSTPAPGEKFVAADASINSVYIAPGWAEDVASEATVNYNSSTGAITASILNALGGQWQGQIKLNLGFAYNASKYYDFSIKFHASKAIGGVTLKSNNDNALFYEDQSISLPADADYVWTKSDVAGVAGDNIFVFDFGWAAAGTDITISEISIIEKDEPSTPPTPVDPNDYTAGGHTIHLEAYHVNDIYTLNITSTDNMEGLGGSFWNVNGVGADMRTNTGTSSYTVSGDKKTITCQVQSSSAPNIYTPLYVLIPGEVNFGNVTLNWEDRTPITSEYCNYQGPETQQDNHYYAITFETDPSGNVVITIGNGTGAGACSFRNGGFEGGNNGLANFVVSDDDFATTTPATDYFTVTRPSDGDLQYVMTKIADLPAGAKIKHLTSGAIAWREGSVDRWCYPEFTYAYGGTCNQLDAPTNVAIDANNILTFDAVAGADSYMAYVSLGGVEKYSQAVASGDELTYTALVTGDYIINVVASGAGKVDSDPSADVVWHLEAAPVVLGNSEYCEHVFMADDNREAAFTLETDADGNIVITISATRGDAAATHFRNTGMRIDRFSMGSAHVSIEPFFNHSCVGNQVTLTLKDPANAPALGEKIYFNNTVEYATSLDGDAWPTLNFEWTYGTICSGKSVSASVNNNTMGSAVVQKAGVDVTNVDAGDEVSFIATVADPALYRFVNWTKGGVEVSTSATYVATITETTNLVANFDYVRSEYCHYELLATGGAAVGKKLYMTLGSIGGGKYQIKYEGSAEAPLLGLNNANYVVNGVSTDIVYEDQPMSGNDVPFSKQNGRWSFDATGYGSAKMEFSLADGKTIDDIYVWENNIYFNTSYGELAYHDNNDRLGLFGMNAAHRHNIAWNSTCSDTEAPVFDKAEAEVLNATSVQLKIQATDNWGGLLTYTIARADASDIILNGASGEELTQEVTGLTTNTEYDFTVTVSDDVNDAVTHIVVTPIADNEKPVMGEASLASKTWNSAIINVAATDNKGVTAYYIVELAEEYVAAEGKITVTGLTAATDYTLHIKAKDAAGNISDNQAEVSFTTDAHLLAPTTVAPVPTWPAAQVKSIYSDSYSLAPSAIPNYNDCWWDCPNANEGDVEGNNYMLYNLYRNGMIGVSFADISVATMEKIHIDIWASAAGSLTFRPITTSGPNNPKTLNLLGQQWNSFDIEMSEFDGHNWADLYQYTFENYQAGGLVGEYIAVDNVYFYRETALADDEVPTNAAANLTETGFYSVKITASAEDNSGAVNFSVMNGAVEVATGSAATATATTITVNGLTPGTAYSLNVIAKDDAGNEAAPVAVAANTLAAPTAAPVPTVPATAVKSLYSNAYTTAVPVAINYREWWWESPNVQGKTLGAGDDVLFYDNNHQAGGSFGWAWSGENKVDFSGFQKLHLHIYPAKSGTIEIYPVIAPEGEFHKVSQTLTAGQWNEIILDYTDKTFAPLNQVGFVNFYALGEFFVDNVYFFKEPSYTRPVSINIGTLCVDHNVPAGGIQGAIFYQIAGKDANGKLVFDEVTELVAGEPYIFESTTGSIALYYDEASVTEPVEVQGMKGSLANVDVILDITEENKKSIMYISNNKLYDCSDLVGTGLTVKPNRCYIDYSKVTELDPNSNPAPGRRRITLGKDGQNATTDVDLLNAAEAPVKMIIDGKMYILRGEKMYNANGQLVK